MVERYYDSSWKRTMYCGAPRLEDAGSQIVLNGWLRARRDLGGIIFIELWDKTGATQVVFNPEFNAEAHERAGSLRSEYVLAVKGKLRQRPEGTENPEIKTGQVELLVDDFLLLSPSRGLPFEIDNADEVNEDTRLKYRYLDLRREKMQNNLYTRHRVAHFTRNYFADHGFMEVETPMLTKSTPEGARDYLVPSRVNPGRFYALPQSPQLFKQLLMVSGCDRYMQIVKCFRDEDLRADRQPEFTQLDLEMSFITEDDVMGIVENYLASLFKEVLGVEVKTPFLRMTWKDAMNLYGIDKPEEWEICLPVETRIDGLSTFVKARLFSGDTPLAARANMVWDSMTKLNPPKKWYASVGGKPLAKSIKIDPRTGDKIGVISKVRWTNLALTAQPVNQHVNQVATIPFGVLAKSWGADGFDITKALEASYSTDVAALTGGGALGMQSLDGAQPQSYYDFRDRLAGALKSGKVKDQSSHGLIRYSAEKFSLQPDEAAEWVDRFLSDLKSGLSNRSTR